MLHMAMLPAPDAPCAVHEHGRALPAPAPQLLRHQGRQGAEVGGGGARGAAEPGGMVHGAWCMVPRLFQALTFWAKLGQNTGSLVFQSL